MIIKNVLKKFLSVLPLKKVIVFESRPDLTDNSKAVFDEMVKRGLNKKYKMVWLCFEKDNRIHVKIRKTIFVKYNTFLATYYLVRAKVIVCCNRFIKPYFDSQFSIFLAHGTAIKNVGSYYRMPKEIRYCLSASNNTVYMRMKEFDLPKYKVVPLGFPRNDDLTNKQLDLHAFFDLNYKKIVVWYPTVRQFKNNYGNITDSKHAIPLLWDNEAAIDLNLFAKRNNILIVIKPHFAQDLNYIKELNLTNIVFINDDFLSNRKISSYEFLANCDALITDFSSVYFDYTLCDKPIGLVWEDYSEYKNNPGFAVDVDKMMIGGVKIFNLEDMKSFLNDVLVGNDALGKERREIRDFANYSTDGKNSTRVVDFITKKANLL